MESYRIKEDVPMPQFSVSLDKVVEKLREKIGEMTAEFDFPEFEPVSFVSSENANVNAVQFVMATSPIEKPEAPQEEEAPAPEPTLWDRLLALFQG